MKHLDIICLLTIILLLSGYVVTTIVLSENYSVTLATHGTIAYVRMTLATSPYPSKINQIITIWGSLKDSAGNPISQRNVSVYYSRDSLTWKFISAAMSNSSGVFSIRWTPTQTGQLYLRATTGGAMVEKEHVVADRIVALDGSGDFSDIQTAISSLSLQGGTIFIKNGTYILSRGLSTTGKSNVSLVGNGYDTKIVKDNGLTFRIENITNLTIRKLHFHHLTNNHYEDLSINGFNDGLIIESCWFTRDDGPMQKIVDLVFFNPNGTTRNLLIRNNYFQFAQIDAMAVKKVIGGIIQNNTILDAATNTNIYLGSGMTIENCSNLQVKENYIKRNGNQSMGGINIFGGSKDIIVENNTITNVEWGVNIGDAKGIQVVHNRLYDSFSSGVRVEGAMDVRIEGNCVEELTFNRKVPGIYITQSQNISVMSNTIRNVQSGIRLLNNDQVFVSHNTIDLGGKSLDTGGYGIQLYECQVSQVKNNTILRSPYIGLVVTDSPWVQILSNTIAGSQLSGIKLTNSDNSVIVGNTLKNNGKDTSQSIGRNGADLVSSFNCTFRSNRVFDDQQTKTQLFGFVEGGISDYNLIIENDFRWNALTAMRVIGEHTVAYGNLV